MYLWDYFWFGKLFSVNEIMPSAGFCGHCVFTGALPKASVNAYMPHTALSGIPVFTVFILLAGRLLHGVKTEPPPDRPKSKNREVQSAFCNALEG